MGFFFCFNSCSARSSLLGSRRRTAGLTGPRCRNWNQWWPWEDCFSTASWTHLNYHSWSFETYENADGARPKSWPLQVVVKIHITFAGWWNIKFCATARTWFGMAAKQSHSNNENNFILHWLFLSNARFNCFTADYRTAFTSLRKLHKCDFLGFFFTLFWVEKWLIIAASNSLPVNPR